MPAPVSLVTIHHEGAGTPSDVPRGAAEGYTYWIGASRWEHLRTVWTSFATLRFNHVSLDICLSGNRMTSPVSDGDIALIRGAVADARSRGYVIASPQVRAHRDSPGSSTVCPGDNTMARWNEVVAACTSSTPAPTPKEPEMPQIISNGNGGYWVCFADGSVNAYGGATYHGGANALKPPPKSPIISMAASPTGGGYWQLAKDKSVYAFGDAQYAGHP